MSQNDWAQRANTYRPDATALRNPLLPPGIYEYGTQMQGWFLTKTRDRYHFPFKVYGVNDNVINRVARAVEHLSQSVGVLLNGLKGTGKTVTAQMLANWAVDNGIIVLSVRDPIPLADVLETINQPVLVLFDEFEKTHHGQLHPGAQQSILSTLDGLSRGEHKRIFVFTTNLPTIDANMLDRPSRIRYRWEFTQIPDKVITMLLDDMLDPELTRFRADIIGYLRTRNVLTIDAVKTIITEVNIFREAPTEFAGIMNLSEREPSYYKLDLVGKDGETKELASYFKPTPKREASRLDSYLTAAGGEIFDEQWNGSGYLVRSLGGQHITLFHSTEKPDEYVCEAQVNLADTWVGLGSAFKFKIHETYRWLDEKPLNWTRPTWALKLTNGEALTTEETEAFDAWTESGTVYGTNCHAKVKVRFTADRTPTGRTFRYDQNGHVDAGEVSSGFAADY